MTPAVDHWLTRFAAGSGTLLDWSLDPHEIARPPAWTRVLIRARVAGCPYPLCPLTAQASLEDGRLYAVGAAHAAGQAQGLHPIDRQAIMWAADGDRDADPEVRARLLRICRLAP